MVGRTLANNKQVYLNDHTSQKKKLKYVGTEKVVRLSRHTISLKKRRIQPIEFQDLLFSSPKQSKTHNHLLLLEI